MRYPLRYKGLGRSKGIEPSTAEPQTAVLPLHHDRHVGYLHTNVQGGLESSGTPHPPNERRVCACGGGGIRTPNRTGAVTR